MATKPKKPRGPSEKSKLEAKFKLHLRGSKIIGWVPQHKFCPTRKWTFDFAWPDKMLALECEGGVSFYVKRKSDGKNVRVSGKHSGEKGFNDDCEKYNEALLLGWRVLRVTGKQIGSLDALKWVQRALEAMK